MKKLSCAICGTKEDLHVLFGSRFNKKDITNKTFSARRTPDRMHYQFVRCNRCSLIFSTPIFAEKEIKNLYKESTFDYGSESSFLKKTYGEYLNRAIKGMSRPLKLLDIGCGNGFFLEEALQKGVEDVYGVEPGKETVKKSPLKLQSKIKVAMYDKKLFLRNFFDIITCFHTLDHIVEVNVFLKAVFYHLKKKGKILFIVHDTEGLSVKLFGENSPIFDIEHIYLFNKKTLEEIFKKNGFTNIHVFPIVNTYPLIYWTRMIPLPQKAKNLLLGMLSSTFLDNIGVSIPAGNIGIIAEK